MAIKSIYYSCYKKIGGCSNADIRWYLNKRPKTITRSSFFDAAVFAVWVAGMTRVAVTAFLKRAERNGFSRRYKDIVNCSQREWNLFLKLMHISPTPSTAKKKWNAIRTIAKRVNDFESEEEFRLSWFNGHVKSRMLNNDSVRIIKNLKMPFIGPANSQFIIRNMGGEAIKCDRWINAFMRYYKITQHELLSELKLMEIPEGQFDLVIWAYCEMFVKKTNSFDNHFRKVFG